MYDRQKITCPECSGLGQKSVPGILDGKPHTSIRTCRKCRGVGKLTIVVDHRTFSGKGRPTIILPGSTDILLPGGKVHKITRK